MHKPFRLLVKVILRIILLIIGCISACSLLSMQVNRKLLYNNQIVDLCLELPYSFDETRTMKCDFYSRQDGPGTTVFAIVENDKDSVGYIAYVTIASRYDIIQLKKDCSDLIRNKVPVESQDSKVSCSSCC